MNKTESEDQRPDEASGINEIGEVSLNLLEQLSGKDTIDLLDKLAESVREDKDQQASQASGETAQVHERNQASGDNAQGGESLEDLLRSLHSQIKSSDWLQQNTAEKWVAENPQLAKDYMEAAKKS